jgi:hypothetical protein
METYIKLFLNKAKQQILDKKLRLFFKHAYGKSESLET